MQTFRVLGVVGIFALLILGYALWGRSGREASLPPAPTAKVIPVSQLAELQPVKDIQLEYHQPDMPAGPGREQFVTQCVICHSPRYVLNEPIFPRKTWTTEVTKMVKAYGAPITPGEQESIVDYLVAWHGEEDPPAAPTQNTK